MKKEIQIGNKMIGGGNPVLIQSMTNTNTIDVHATTEQIKSLEKVGCEAVRIAIPDEESANKIPEIKKMITIPLIADIHFDYKLALKSIEKGIDKLRLNPGNIGADWKVKEVAEAARDNNIPIRVGVNWGSVPEKLKKQDKPEKIMAELAEKEIQILEKTNFYQIVVSLKASSVSLMIDANRYLSERCDYPLHLGVTEAGLPAEGSIKSAIGIGTLLSEGIGDTIRVSLTGNPIQEIPIAKSILEALNLREFGGVKIISCPTCARTRIDVESIAREVNIRLSEIDDDITVAIMGCEVNGPGEAREADIGIAGGKGYGILFEKGKVKVRIDEKNMIDDFVGRVKNYLKNRD